MYDGLKYFFYCAVLLFFVYCLYLDCCFVFNFLYSTLVNLFDCFKMCCRKNSVMASSSSVHFKWYLCNQVDDIAVNEVSPTKQVRGDSGKEPKLHR